MEKIISVNCYIRNKSSFVVIMTESGIVASVNTGLLNYALSHAKKINSKGEKENAKTKVSI